MKERYGNAIFGILLTKEAKYRAGSKWSIVELRELLAKLKEQYEEMK
jgi:hypothetical protein